jgi:hypothetical protein
MDKKELLKRLTSLFNITELKYGFKSQQDAISWSNRVAPLLRLVNAQYYNNFIQNSHILNLNLSSFTLEPAFNIMKSQIEMAIEDLKLRIDMEEEIPDQIYFPENSPLDIQKQVARIIGQAQNSLLVYDAYMDEKIIEELTEVPAPEIRLLTQTPKGLFHKRLNAAKQQLSSKNIEARISNKSYDRFFIIDKDQVWSLGTSLNKAGQKATLLSKIKTDKEKQKIIGDFEDWWRSANSI